MVSEIFIPTILDGTFDQKNKELHLPKVLRINIVQGLLIQMALRGEGIVYECCTFCVRRSLLGTTICALSL